MHPFLLLGAVMYELSKRSQEIQVQVTCQSVIYCDKEKQGVAENDEDDIRQRIGQTLQEGKTQNPVLLPFYVSRKSSLESKQ